VFLKTMEDGIDVMPKEDDTAMVIFSRYLESSASFKKNSKKIFIYYEKPGVWSTYTS
jgi:hypothetical protein